MAKSKKAHANVSHGSAQRARRQTVMDSAEQNLLFALASYILSGPGDGTLDLRAKLLSAHARAGQIQLDTGWYTPYTDEEREDLPSDGESTGQGDE